MVLGSHRLVRWPLVGFMVGSVTGDPTAWHKDKQVVRLCSRLTWVLVAAVHPAGGGAGADLLAGSRTRWTPTTAVAALGIAKLAMGWPLQLAAWR